MLSINHTKKITNRWAKIYLGLVDRSVIDAVKVNDFGDLNRPENLKAFLKARKKAYHTYRSQIIATLKAQGMGATITEKDLSWSQYTGCKCGCSPAFRVLATHTAHCDLWIEG